MLRAIVLSQNSQRNVTVDQPRIDAARVKAQADAALVFQRCGVVLLGSGSKRTARCPFHEDHRPSLSVNLDEKVYYCHACGHAGDLIDFVAECEDCSFREAAEHIAKWCGFELPLQSERPSQGYGQPSNGRSNNVARRVDKANLRPRAGGREYNRPLNFFLSLDPDHVYLKQRGLSGDVIAHFGLGYCSCGTMSGRICIPIHDCDDCSLVGYAGRWASEEVPEDTPRYRLPRGFHKNAVLYNLNRTSGHEHLVIVEGFFGVFALFALQVPAIALMGRTLSPRQEELLQESGAERLTLLLDGDGPGKTATTELMPRLARKFFVYAPDLPDNAQPDTVDSDILRAILHLP